MWWRRKPSIIPFTCPGASIMLKCPAPTVQPLTPAVIHELPVRGRQEETLGDELPARLLVAGLDGAHQALDAALEVGREGQRSGIHHDDTGHLLGICRAQLQYGDAAHAVPHRDDPAE